MNKKLEQAKQKEFNSSSNTGQAAEFPWLPGCMVKLHPEDRIAGGEILTKCIQSEKLDLLLVPKQYLYKIPKEYHKDTPLRTLCISEKIEGKLGKSLVITYAQVKQLLKLIIQTGVADLKWRNLVHCPGGKIALIETESFFPNKYAIDSLLWSNTCDKQAQSLLRKKLADLAKSPFIRL